MRSQCNTSMSLPSEADDDFADDFHSFNPVSDESSLQSGSVHKSHRKFRPERTESESTQKQIEAFRDEIKGMRKEIQNVRQELIEAIQCTRYDILKEIVTLKGQVATMSIKIDSPINAKINKLNHTTANGSACSEGADDNEILSNFVTPDRSTVLSDCSHITRLVSQSSILRESGLPTLMTMDEANLSKPLSKDEIDEMFPLIDCSGDVESNALKLASGTRGWALDHITKWIQSNFENGNERVLTIVGEGGAGKSTLAGYVCQKFAANLHAYHFFQFDRKLGSSSRDVVLSLVSQFASKLQLYKRQLTRLNLRYILAESNPLVMATKLLIDPLRAIPESDSTFGFVLFDGIDQCLVKNQSNDLLELLSHITERFPSWIGFVVTSKAFPAFAARLKTNSVIHLDGSNVHFLQDSRILMENLLLYFEPKHTNEACDILMRKSGGNSLYLQFINRALSHPILHGEQTFLSLDVLDELPESVDEIIFTIFDDKFGQGHQRVWKNAKPILEVIVAAAAGPYPLVGESQIKQQFELRENEWRMINRAFTDIIHCGTDGYRIINSSLYDWLVVEKRSQHFHLNPQARIKFLR